MILIDIMTYINFSWNVYDCIFFFFYITYENIWEEKFIRVLLQNDLNISIEFLFYIQILWIKRKNILRKENKNQCSVINYYNKLWNIY